MPRMNGLEATRNIRQILPQTKIIILSQHDIPQMMKQAFSMGAHAYVVKSAMSDQLITALETVKRGGVPSSDIYGSTQVNIDVQEILQRSVVFERALRETEERLRLAQQAARVGSFEFNFKTGVYRWTPELEALYGLRPGTFSGTYSAWEMLIHPEDRHATVTAFKESPVGQVFESEWRVIWPDSSVHWLLGRAWLFSDKDGKPERWVGVNIEITDASVRRRRRKSCYGSSISASTQSYSVMLPTESDIGTVRAGTLWLDRRRGVRQCNPQLVADGFSRAVGGNLCGSEDRGPLGRRADALYKGWQARDGAVALGALSRLGKWRAMGYGDQHKHYAVEGSGSGAAVAVDDDRDKPLLIVW